MTGRGKAIGNLLSVNLHVVTLIYALKYSDAPLEDEMALGTLV